MARWCPCCAKLGIGYLTRIQTMKDLDFIDNHLPMDEEDLKELQKRTLRMKIDMLMEEPCRVYEGDSDDWEDFWQNEDK